MSAATAVTVFHRTPDAAGFAGWADLLEPFAGVASAAAAIVLVTLLVRAALIPVGVSQAKAERTRARLAPRIAELRRRTRTRCMRVRVIASRISAIIPDNRSNAPSTATSPEASRSRRASSLRASTMSETPDITRSRSATDRRMVRGVDVPLPLASAATAAAAATTGPSARASPATR